MAFTTKTNTDAPDQLFAGDFPVVTKSITLTGAAFVRGSVIGIITASGKGVLVDNTLGNGAQTAEGILLDYVDASGADKSGIIALTGDFNGSALTFGGDDVVADHVAALRNKSIFIHKTAAAVQ